jgi:steroid delta-isomerase-like uncharacterized protein
MADNEQAPGTVDELVSKFRKGQISRRALLGGLAGLGLTAGGALTVARSVSQHAATNPKSQPVAPVIPTPTEHIELHDQHINNQLRGHTGTMMADYADNAVVEDPLFTKPFVGIEAIAQRYTSEVFSVPDRALRILNRVVQGEQLIVEWEATGTHVNDFLGFGGTGRSYTLRGTTVVTRHNGKIVRETHYYDVASLRKQVEKGEA